MGKINILVFPCGSEIAFEIHHALKYNVNFNLIGASSLEDQCKTVFNQYIGGVPYIKDPDFIDKLNQIIEKHDIGLIFPTHDSVTLFLSENQELINTKLAVPELETAMICRNKKLTYQHFSSYDFNPDVYHLEDGLEFPLFQKPNIGEGGKNTQKINNQEELLFYYSPEGEDLLLEYLPGEELTVDCFTDRHGELRFIGPRIREKILGGISVHTKRVEADKEITTIAHAINNELNLRGLWFFQLKKDRKEKYKLLEISARTSSTMGLFRNLGVNFHLLTAYDLLDLDVDILFNDNPITLHRSFLNKYHLELEYNTVYIDFDDTITRNGKVNEFVMLFVYQQVRMNKKLILVTRHEFDIHETLKNLKIDPKLFDKIILLNTAQSKADFITQPESSIFIDNAFKDRWEVKEKWNMPVYDVDAIQSLIDWKE
ncbi:MAG: ATP-grasp domain-containing protein [bacterium]